MDTLTSRYRLDERIAAGAAGEVWRGVERATGTPVAVKRLRPGHADDRDATAAFLAEAETLTVLDHPSVIRLRDLVSDGGGYAIVLDLVHGLDLRRRLTADGPAPPAAASELVAQAAAALAYLHGRGVVHGDVKPGNILVPADGAPVRLADFGLSRRTGGGGAPTHATPEYVAPELVAGGPPSPAADMYALGVTLFEALCGRSPYRGGTSLEIMLRHATCAPVRPDGMPLALWRVIEECLRKDPQRRPRAADVAVRLRAVAPDLIGYPVVGELAADVVTFRPLGPAEPVRRRLRVLAGLATLGGGARPGIGARLPGRG